MDQMFIRETSQLIKDIRLYIKNNVNNIETLRHINNRIDEYLEDNEYLINDPEINKI